MRFTADAPNLIRTGESISVKATVTGPDGHAVEGAAVTFVAPASGPGGEFAAVRVTTAGDGSAQAVFQANDTAGPYLVSAVVANSTGVASLALTNLAAPVSPVIPAQQARAFALTEAPEGGELHGPFLLPAGSRIRSAATEPQTAARVERDSWFFWVDEVPLALYEHPTRFFFFFDAMDANPRLSAAPSRHAWWPVVEIPGGGRISLLPPVYTVLPPAAASPAVPVPAGMATAGRIPVGDAQTAVIAIHGPDAATSDLDVEKFERFATNTLNLPREQIFDIRGGGGGLQPVTLSEWRALVDRVQAGGFQNIIVFYSGHGYAGGMTWADDDGEEGDDGNALEDAMRYRDFADTLKPLADSGAEFHFIIGACSSGSAIRPLQGRGLKGEVITAASAAGSSYGVPFFGQPFVNRVITYWTGELLNTGTNVSLGEVYPQIEQNSVGIVEFLRGESSPRYSIIEPVLSTYPLDDIWLPTVAAQTESIVLGPPPGQLVYPVTIEVAVRDTGVAQVNGDSVLRIRLTEPPTAPIRIPVRGVRSAATTYRVTATDYNARAVEGSAKLEVGNVFAVPHQVTVIAGQEAPVRLERKIIAGIAPDHTYRIQSAANAAAGVALVNPEQVRFAEGAATALLAVDGIRPGRTRFDAIGPSPAFQTNFDVEVIGYSTDQAVYRLTVGDTLTVQIRKPDQWVEETGATTVDVTAVSSEDASVASVNPSPALFPPRAASAPVVIRGLKAGTAQYRIVDRNFRTATPLTIIVEPPSLGCLIGGEFPVRLNVRSDANALGGALGQTQTLRLSHVGNGLVNLATTNPGLASTLGQFDLNTCTMPDAAGVGRFGDRSYLCHYSNLITNAAAGTISGSYRCDNSGLELSFDGTVRSGTGVFVPGGQRSPLYTATSVSVRVGETAQVRISRDAAQRIDAARVRIVPRAGAAAIAEVTPTEVPLAFGVTSATVTARGLEAGVATFDVIDHADANRRTSFTVMVSAAAPAPGAVCVTGGRFTATNTIISNQGNHPLRLSPSLTLTAEYAAPNTTLAGNDPLTFRATGVYDLRTCRMDRAEGRGTVAGRPNVLCRYSNLTVDPATGRGSVEYGCGEGGELPTGNPIRWRLDLTAQPGTLVTVPRRGD